MAKKSTGKTLDQEKTKSKEQNKNSVMGSVYQPQPSDDQIETDNDTDILDGKDQNINNSGDNSLDSNQISDEAEGSGDDDIKHTYVSVFEDPFDAPNENYPFAEFTTLLRFIENDMEEEKGEKLKIHKYIPIAKTFNGYHVSWDDADKRGYGELERFQIINLLGEWIENNRQKFLRSLDIKDLSENAYDEFISGHFPCTQIGLLQWLLKIETDETNDQRIDSDENNDEKSDIKMATSTFSRYLDKMVISCNGLDIKIEILFSKDAKIAWAAWAYYSAVQKKYEDDNKWIWSRKWQEELLVRQFGKKELKVPKGYIIPELILDKGKVLNPSWDIARCIMKTLSVKFEDICNYIEAEIIDKK